MSEFLRDYLTVAIFGAVAAGLLLGVMSLGKLIRPVRPQGDKYMNYESGVDPVGEAWDQSPIRYYVFALLFVLFDVEEEEKEDSLWTHSEKVAIALGLIEEADAPIRIVKNLRVCWDCHDWTKMVSLVFKREIVVRDRNRFHHFKDGECSCKGYW